MSQPNGKLHELEEVLVSRERLAEHVRLLGQQISAAYAGQELVLVCILKGGSVFLADLMRAIEFPVEIDFMSVSSYGHGSVSSGKITLLKDIDTDITGKHVLIVEDLVDTGQTLHYLKQLFALREAASVAITAILSKPSRRLVDLEPDFPAIEIPDAFVVGYGLDYAGQYRNLPDLWQVRTAE